jgi:hypothetical protein
MKRVRLTVVLVWVAALGVWPRPTLGQAVRGQVVERLSGTPVAGAFIVLQDSAGREHARALTDSRGRFVVVGRTPGWFRLRTLIVGFQSWQSEPFAAALGETHVRRIELDLVQVALPALTVEAERVCRVRPEEGVATAALWEEVRKALAVTQFTIDERLYRFRTSVTDRTLNRYRQPESEEAGVTFQYNPWPFSTLPAERLIRRGFVQPAPGGPVYYGPDAQVLVSDVFLDTHCFRLERDDAPAAGLIGLAFEPVADRRVPEIAGVLWVDSASVALRRLDYRYVNLARWVPERHVGGEIEFDVLPSGAWFIRRWRLRAPIAEVGRVAGDSTLHGFRERIGEVVEVLDASGETVKVFGER